MSMADKTYCRLGLGVFTFLRSFCIIVSFDIGGGKAAVFDISTFLVVGWGRTEAVNNMFYEVDIFLSFFLLRAYIYIEGVRLVFINCYFF